MTGPALSASLLGSFSAPSNARDVAPREVAEHCGRGSKSGKTWVVVHGHVFDVTAFVSQHPGGQVIRLAAGKCVTARC